MKTTQTIVSGPHGLGDNIYQRAVLNGIPRDARDSYYVITPWPDLLPEGFKAVKPDSPLRTQRKHEDSFPNNVWSVPPERANILVTRYGAYEFAAGLSILDVMANVLGVSKPIMNLPDDPAWRSGKYMVVRPATLRREWYAEARNPDPVALYQAVDLLRKQGFTSIVVADLSKGEEWALEPMPPGDVFYTNGELTRARLFGLCAGASIIVGGVGWIVPYALASNKPALILHGGNGIYNSWGQIVGRLAPPNRITFLPPDKFCQCGDLRHACNKYVSYTRILESVAETLRMVNGDDSNYVRKSA